MATRKSGKGKGGKRSGKSKFFRFLLVLGLLVATLLVAFVLLILRPYENQPPAPAKSAKVKVPARPVQKDGGPAKRAAPAATGQPGTAARSSQPLGPGAGNRELPLLAIVIDDMGYQKQLDADLLHLNLNLTFAFLPESPHTPEHAELAGRLGREVLLHLPMEPSDQRWDPGPGALTLAMTPAERAAVFTRDLARVPQAVGINNHMGSRFTEDQAAMQDLLGLVRDRRLFFLDSLTSPASLGYTLAREMGVKTCRREVFLDNVREPDRIRAQIRELLAVAERQGWAVGIGHPYPQTLAALREARPEILSRAKLVGVSHLAH
ncbi:MAG TPA: divergent polysaccharide deacetylase family protein [Desulfurivibrionaceae bacterium]|nr:divergent polysaccharide deacetylase family protein [Desulfurivibrionaceae bacterium]